MLDMKHKNIGATVSMLKLVNSVDPENTLPGPIAELFMAESNDCDWKSPNKHCLFNNDVANNSAKGTVPCCVGECPLGGLVDEELKGTSMNDITKKFGCDPEEDRLMLYGKNTMRYGSHVHIGYTGWRKWWDNFKRWIRR